MTAPPSSRLRLNINNSSKAGENETEKDLNWYLPLYKAAIRGDWESARRFFDLNPDGVMEKITRTSETALHLAVGKRKTIHFVEKLMELVSTEALVVANQFNETALHFAAKFGNTEAAKLLVTKNAHLPHIWSNTELLPLHLATLFGHKETVVYLLTVTKDDVDPCPFADEPGIKLLNIVVDSGFYDVALDLLRRYPKLATTVSRGGNTPLSIIAGKPSAFPSGSCLNFWQRLVYSCVPLRQENLHHSNVRDIENLPEISQQCMQMCCQVFGRKHFISVCQKLHAVIWEIIEGLVPHVMHIRDTKLMHQQALQLVKCLCVEIISVDNSKAAKIFKPPVLLGASLGIHEVVEEILRSFPTVIWSLDKEQHDVFQLAVINRHGNIFNLLYQMNGHRHMVAQISDINGNNILHLAGKLAPPHRLNLVTGAALQMQRELQWFKEVEKHVQPNYREKKNSAGRTPAMVFTEEHKNLVRDGDQWLKDTAKSCIIAASLIAMVVCAAAITVPGGNNGDVGSPILFKEKPFAIFSISNSFSLFSSTTSVLMLLFILTSRCAESDFLYAMPMRLIIGLVTLFLSITSMMVTFSASIYLVFGDKKAWILIPLAALACLPVTLFVFLQFPLLVEMIKSTCGPSIFSKRSEHPFY
ncbi:uncharacterized protein LOC132277028 isoform X2 [Cornus florida]|uniref:uncharacterized protein LOC132277028 isoform X2 n=1 Tax=Cornus florida TaxID=4283 RepID=UPI00289E1F37|nr:uncharacterized protein LOC132277028 isoform X2 [Cornus florida]